VTTSALPTIPAEPRPPKVRTRPAAALFEPGILGRAIRQAFVKLDPRVMIHIPVMFVVEIGSVITTVEFIASPSLFVGLVTLWLWATVLFANFAEAVAEGRGKAQADTLRKARKDTVAHRLKPDGTLEDVPSIQLKVGAGAASAPGDLDPVARVAGQLLRLHGGIQRAHHDAAGHVALVGAHPAHGPGEQRLQVGAHQGRLRERLVPEHWLHVVAPHTP
jgi:hypothetical protein